MMIFDFTTNVKKGNRCLATIPHYLCKEYNLKLKDVVHTTIQNCEFFSFVTGTNSSKRITIPLEIFKKLKLGKQYITVFIIPKRKAKTTIVNGKIDLYHSLPNQNKHFNWPLAVINDNNKLKVWSPQAYYQIIPRYLDLNEELFEIFGLYQGEGYKKFPNGGTRIGFVNSNVNIINKFLDFFENCFLIPRKKWSAFINYSSNQDEFQEKNNKLIEFWSSRTKIPINNFKRVNYLKGKGVRSVEFGVLHLFIPSCVLGEITLAILEILEDLSIKDPEYAAWFLRGLMAADGSATLYQYKQYKTIRVVELALETEHERVLYTNVLKRIGLNVKDYSLVYRKLNICGWDDFLKLAQINVFKLHDLKRRNFKEGFFGHQQTRMILKYVQPLQNKEMSMNELLNVIGITSKGSLHQTLKVQLERNLIQKIKKKGEYKYSLTKKGQTVLKFLSEFIFS